MHNAECKLRSILKSKFTIAFETGLWCNSSISAREADGPGANPGFLTILLKKKNAANV